MTSQGFQSRLRRKRPSRGRKDQGMRRSDSNDGKLVFTPQESRQNGSPNEVLRMASTFGAEVNVANSSSTHQPPQEMKMEKPKRFIAFIGKPDSVAPWYLTVSQFILGNLPFSANHDTIKRHFVKLDPISIRHPKNKTNGKSKGFAFVEFAGYDRMKTCLKIYHHSIFDDGESPPRKINVELTYFPFHLFRC